MGPYLLQQDGSWLVLVLHPAIPGDGPQSSNCSFPTTYNFVLFSLFPLFKMWLKQVSKPLAVRGIRFSLLWTVPCTQSILHCESSYLFPCLLAFWPPSASAFLLPSLCFPSSPPVLAALLTRWNTWPARLVGAAWHPFPHLASRMHRCSHCLLFSRRTFWLLPAPRWPSTSS